MAFGKPQNKLSGTTKRWTVLLAQNLALAVLYSATGLLGQMVAIEPGNVTSQWAPSGIAIAAIFLFGYRILPGIFLGVLIDDLIIFFQDQGQLSSLTLIATATCISIGATLQAVSGAWLFTRTTGSRDPLSRVIHIIAFISLSGVVSCLISPTIGVTSLAAGGLVPWSAYLYTWWTWFLGDSSGVIIIAPLLLAWAKPFGGQLKFSRFMEAVLLTFFGIILLILVFDRSGFFGVKNDTLVYLVIPLVVWTSLRFSVRGTTLAILIISAFSLWGTIHETGPFTAPNRNISLLELQGFLAVVGVTGLVLSIAVEERKCTGEELKEVAKKYRNLIENTTDWVWEINEQGIYTYVSPKVQALLGFTQEEVIGKTPFDLMPPDEAEKIAAIFNDVTTRQEEFSLLDNTLVHKDGHLVIVETSGLPIFDSRGVFQGYRGVDRDVTERIKAEKALETERALLSTALDLLPIPIIFISANMVPFRRNVAADKLFLGTVPGESYISELQLFDANTGARIPFSEWPENRALRGEVVGSFEARLTLSDGREIPVLSHAAPIYLGEKLIAVILAFQDITALKETDRAKNQFLMILSHELKTPLTSILGWTQAARSNPDIIQEALEIIERNAQEQRRLLEDLIDVSRIISGRYTIKPVVADLWQLALQAVDESLRAAANRNITLAQESPDTPLPVNADPGCMIKAIDNLLDNAIKFTQPGGVVTISGRRESSEAVISVKDTGRGIDPQELGELFHPFKQIKREEITGGLGLGLVLIKGIVDAHGGRVEAYSAGLGQGSIFTIALPLSDDK